MDDPQLHRANRMAHEVARTAVQLMKSRGAEHVEAWRVLQEKLAKYERAVNEMEEK